MSVEPVVTNGLMPAKKRSILEVEATCDVTSTPPSSKSTKRLGMTMAREIRLEQNRKSARESRKRKKAMLEELQRSVVFFTNANNALRTEHELLTLKLLNAHTELNNLGLTMPDGSQVEEANHTPSPATVRMPIVAALVEPGVTMQAMATFQQAATAAMQSTAHVMQNSGILLDNVTST